MRSDIPPQGENADESSPQGASGDVRMQDLTPWVRLGALGGVLVAAFVAFWLLDLVDRSDVQGLVEPFGAVAPVVFVVVAALLGAALVPGPILAATSGILFGALLGTAVTICAATLGAVIAVLTARRTAGPAFDAVSGPRMRRLADLARRHAIGGVVVARLVPGLPDAPCSYLFGVLGLRAWQVAAGTAIGALPRAFSYTSIGASIDDPTSPLGLAGFAGVVVTGLVGALLAARLLRRSRPRRPGRRRPRRSGEGRGRTPPSAG